MKLYKKINNKTKIIKIKRIKITIINKQNKIKLKKLKVVEFKIIKK